MRRCREEWRTFQRRRRLPSTQGRGDVGGVAVQFRFQVWKRKRNIHRRIGRENSRSIENRFCRCFLLDWCEKCGEEWNGQLNEWTGTALRGIERKEWSNGRKFYENGRVVILQTFFLC